MAVSSLRFYGQIEIGSGRAAIVARRFLITVAEVSHSVSQIQIADATKGTPAVAVGGAATRLLNMSCELLVKGFSDQTLLLLFRSVVIATFLDM